jgi:hypothetical protein
MLAPVFRRLPIAVAALVAALGGGLRASAPPTHGALIAEPVLTTSPTVPAFRLGTAARPFGWATAIADFNRDGLADTAVADRLSHQGARYLYELRFSVSGLSPRSVSFESAQSALTVSIRDVDHDNDLDVVVSEVFSRAVTSVWLNDGRGHFTEAPAGQEPGRLELLPAMNTGESTGDLEPATTNGERTPTILVFAGFVTPSLRRAVAVTPSHSLRLCDRCYTRPLRAPPASISIAT